MVWALVDRLHKEDKLFKLHDDWYDNYISFKFRWYDTKTVHWGLIDW